MKRIAILFLSKYGHTGRIAAHIASTLCEAGAEPTTQDIGPSRGTAGALDIEAFDGVILGGAIYRGRHGAPLLKYARAHATQFDKRPSFFFSVSLVASSDQEPARAQACAVRDGFLESAGWTPRRSICIAGGLPYRDYGFLTRWIMKRTVKKEGGDTDTSRNYDYTDWEAVAEFALDCLAEVKQGAKRKPESSARVPENGG